MELYSVILYAHIVCAMGMAAALVLERRSQDWE
jgi:hypothetical protein